MWNEKNKGELRMVEHTDQRFQRLLHRFAYQSTLTFAFRAKRRNPQAPASEKQKAAVQFLMRLAVLDRG
jgi:hypothetical protein